MDNIQNKAAMVTGGGSGIGYCIVEELLLNGAKRVAIVDLPVPSSRTATTNLQEKYGKRVIFFPCDVTKEDSLNETFKEVVNALDGLDILVNNAGIFNDNRIEQTFAVNVIALIRGSLLGLDYMGKHKDGKGGTILNMASMAGITISPSILVYNASKHAVVAFSRNLQCFYDKTNVRVLTMCPHLTNTPMTNQDENMVLLDFVDKDMIQNDTECHVFQTPTHIACSTVKLIQKGKNGAVWGVQYEEPPFEIQEQPFVSVCV